MNSTPAEVRALAARLGIGHGELVRMAREIAEDGVLPSLAHLMQQQRNRLHLELKFLELRMLGLKAVLAEDGLRLLV